MKTTETTGGTRMLHQTCWKSAIAALLLMLLPECNSLRSTQDKNKNFAYATTAAPYAYKSSDEFKYVTDILYPEISASIEIPASSEITKEAFEPTESLEQKIEDYANIPEIVFAGEKELELVKDVHSVDDDTTGESIFQTIFKESNSNAEENAKHAEDDSDWYKKEASVEKYMRDTFIDRMLLESLDKRVKRSEPTTVTPARKKPSMTGDTILHINSEISHVIKSEGDLKSMMSPKKLVSKQNSDSYVQGILIHASKFLPDITPYESAESNDEKLGMRRSIGNADAKAKEDKANPGSTKSDRPQSVRNDARETAFNLDDSKYNMLMNKASEEPHLSVTEDGYQKDFPVEKNATLEDNEEKIMARLDVQKVLHCHLPADHHVTAWYKNGEKVSIDMDGPIQLTQSRHIILVRAGREHAGLWACEGRDPQDQLQRATPLRLVLMEPPSPPYLEVFGRRLDASNVFLPAREGTDLLLACRSEGGQPRATLRWDMGGMDFDTMIEESDMGAVTIAKIEVKREYHNTSVGCTASHPALGDDLRASTLLQVQYAPRFGISRVPGFGFPLAEGSPASLRCEVDSNPPAVPRWKKDKGDPPVAESADGYLNFSSVKREHSGWYQCTAQYATGEFSSIAYYLNIRYEVGGTLEPFDPEQAATGEGRVEVALGGAVELQCPPGKPGCWSHVNPDRSSSGVSAEPHGRLSLQGMLYQQAGEYRCQGMSAKDAEALQLLREATIIVEGNDKGGPAVYPPNGSLSASEGGLVDISAEFCANPAPTKVFWLGGGRALVLGVTYANMQASNATNSTSPHCQLARLRLSDLHDSDTGEYSLVVRTPRGIAEGIWTLTVIPIPSSRARSGSDPLQPSSAMLPIMILLLFSQILLS